MTRKNPLVDIIQAEVQIRTQLAVKLSLVIPTDRTGGDSPGGNEPVKKKSKLEYLLYGGRERTQE